MLVFDLEIEKAIPDKNGKREPGIEYATGWDDPTMGIACLCCYDYVEDRYRVFSKGNLDEFRRLVESHDRVIGFNCKAFDNRVCSWSGIEVPEEKCYDLQVEIWAAAGLGPRFEWPSHTGFSLNLVARANGLNGKSGNGAMAPIEWQRGNVGAVIDYCLEDVRLTKQLLDRVIRRGWLVDPRDHWKALLVRRP